MTEQSLVHREVVRLRERLSEFDRAQATWAMDPKLIKASAWANRDSSHFKTEAFIRLKEEIASAGGMILRACSPHRVSSRPGCHRLRRRKSSLN